MLQDFVLNKANNKELLQFVNRTVIQLGRGDLCDNPWELYWRGNCRKLGGPTGLLFQLSGEAVTGAATRGFNHSLACNSHYPGLSHLVLHLAKSEIHELHNHIQETECSQRNIQPHQMALLTYMTVTSNGLTKLQKLPCNQTVCPQCIYFPSLLEEHFCSLPFSFPADDLPSYFTRKREAF